MDTMKYNQDSLFAALKRYDHTQVKDILGHHPELTNLRRRDDFEQEELTPLIEACRRGSPELVDILLENGADFSAAGSIHDHYTSLAPYPHIIKPLDMGSSDSQFGALDDVFPLFASAAFALHAEEKIIKALLSAGADVNQRTAIGQTVLHVLCARSDGGHQANEFSLNDDEYPSETSGMESMKVLLDYGADVNICDHNGRTPLHYAAENGNRYFAKILLKKGTNVYLKDKFGLTSLDYAATKDKLLTMALVDQYTFPTEHVIQAYECVALNYPKGDSRFAIDSDVLQKATLLREGHGIKKTVVEPIEYCVFEREWQTIAQQDQFGGFFSHLLMPCLAARNRISIEMNFDVAPKKLSENLDVRIGTEQNKKLLNSLLRHRLDRISYFGKYLHFAELMVMGDVSLLRSIDREVTLSNDVLVKFVLVAIESCCVIQNRLESERKPGCVQELISAVEQTLFAVSRLLLHLLKRSDRNMQYEYGMGNDLEFNHGIAKVLLNELLHRCPTVSSPFNGYASPVINILFKAKYREILFTHFTEQFFRYNYQLAKMISESPQCDLNATDCDGNTILHIVILELLNEIDSTRVFDHNPPFIEQLMTTSMEIVKLLVKTGSYPHAKNTQGNRPGDIPQETKFYNLLNPEDYLIPMKDLLKKYDSTLTLKYLAATKIVDFKIPYKHLLPKALITFVDLH